MAMERMLAGVDRHCLVGVARCPRRTAIRELDSRRAEGNAERWRVPTADLGHPRQGSGITCAPVQLRWVDLVTGWERWLRVEDPSWIRRC
jgi:hypothetical protein